MTETCFCKVLKEAAICSVCADDLRAQVKSLKVAIAMHQGAEKTADGELKRLSEKLQLAQEVIVDALELGNIDPHEEDEKCPQDDTCSCAGAEKINKALKDFIEKRSEI